MIDGPVLRYHGSKWRIAPWIIKHFPEHKVYVEAFGGSAALLLRKKPSKVEVYNDLDGEVVNLFRVIRDNKLCAELVDLVENTPYARAEYDESFEPSADPVESARRLVIRAYMGFGSNAGTRRSKCGFRANDWSARKSNSHVWLKVSQRLRYAQNRFAGVVIENRPALQLIAEQDSPKTLFYLDPPYIHSTRTSFASGKSYRHEMTDTQHRELYAALGTLKGMVVISGYESELYKLLYAGWQRFITQVCTQGNAGNLHRMECIWLNKKAEEKLFKKQMFLDFTKE